MAGDFDPKEAARLRVENERLAFDCDVLRSANRALTAKLELKTGECEELRRKLAAIEGSRPWKLTQALRGLVGRRW